MYVRQSFARIGQQLPKDQIPDSCRKFFKTSLEELDEIINNILIWFNQHANNRWFLIFDNVDHDNNPEVNDLQSDDVGDFFFRSQLWLYFNHKPITTGLTIWTGSEFGRINDLQETELLQCRIRRSTEGNENQATVLIQFR